MHTFKPEQIHVPELSSSRTKRVTRNVVRAVRANRFALSRTHATNTHYSSKGEVAFGSRQLAVTKDGHTTFSPDVATHPKRREIEAHEAVHRAQFETLGRRPVGTREQLEAEASYGAREIQLGRPFVPTLAAQAKLSLAFAEDPSLDPDDVAAQIERFLRNADQREPDAEMLRRVKIPISPLLEEGDLVLTPGEQLEIQTYSFEELGMRPPVNLVGFTRYMIFDREGRLVRHYIRFKRLPFPQPPAIPPLGEASVPDEPATKSELPQPASQRKRTKPGNPGKFLRRESYFVPRLGGGDGHEFMTPFMRVEAAEDTWLSAACQKLGWDKEGYDESSGFGAYEDGIVYQVGLKPFQHFSPDEIKPGDIFLIRMPTEDKWKPGIPKDDNKDVSKGGVVPDVGDIAPEVDSDIVGKATDLVSIADAVVSFSGASGAVAGVAGIAGVATMAVTVVVGAAEGVTTWERLAKTRAMCFAITSWLYGDRMREPVSKVFTELNFLRKKYEDQCKAGWETGWDETMPLLDPWLTDTYKKLYVKFTAEGKHPPSRPMIKKAMRYVSGSSANFCEKLMMEPKVLARLNSIDRKRWDDLINRAYPDVGTGRAVGEEKGYTD